MKKKIMLHIQSFLAVAALTAVLLPLFLNKTPWPEEPRNYLEASGVKESGAINLVSAIYLGYRVFDTFGETIVLILAVSGTIGLIAHAGTLLGKGALTKGYREEETGASRSLKPKKGTHFHKHRTVLMEVVTGKLGPVVLVFGLYVMFFGHVSPGGGFQGGVVITSGIVFLFLGARNDNMTALSRANILSRLESAGFLLFVLASIAGVAAGGGFFANPFIGTPIPPEGFIIILNSIIGLKVGSGMAYICVAMLGDVEL